MKKRSFSVLLFTILTVGLMGCGEPSDEKDTDAAAGKEPPAESSLSTEDEMFSAEGNAPEEDLPDSIGIQFCTSHTAAIGQNIYVNTGMSICCYDENTGITFVPLRQDGIRYLAAAGNTLLFLGNSEENTEEIFDTLYSYNPGTGEWNVIMELKPHNYELLAWQDLLYLLSEDTDDTSVTCYRMSTDGTLQVVQDAPEIDRSISLPDLYEGELFDFLPEYAEIQGQWVIAYTKTLGGYYFHNLNSGKQIRPIVSALTIFEEDMDGMEVLLTTAIDWESDILLPDPESAMQIVKWLREVPLVETAVYKPSDYYVFLRDMKGIPRLMCGISDDHLTFSERDYEIAANTFLPSLIGIAEGSEVIKKIPVEDILLYQYGLIDGGFTKEDIVYDEAGCPMILVNSGVQPFYWDESKEYYSEVWIIGEGVYFDEECGTTYRIVNALVYYDENGEEIGTKTSASYYDYISGEQVLPENWQW